MVNGLKKKNREDCQVVPRHRRFVVCTRDEYTNTYIVVLVYNIVCVCVCVPLIRIDVLKIKKSIQCGVYIQLPGYGVFELVVYS